MLRLVASTAAIPQRWQHASAREKGTKEHAMPDPTRHSDQKTNSPASRQARTA